MPDPVSVTSMVGPGPPSRTMIRTLPPGGVYLTALSTRLISACRITRRSTHAGTGSDASTANDCCFSSASTPRCAATSRASSARSTPSRLSDTLPPSARESVRSPSTSRPRWSVSSSMLPMISRYAAASRCSRRPTSPTLRIAVSGVRSSCEASAVKRRSCSKDRSSRANASLNTAASCPSSSPRILDGKPLSESLGRDRPGTVSHAAHGGEHPSREEIAAHRRDPHRERKPRTHDHEELAQLSTEWLFRPSHLDDHGETVDGVGPTQTPDANVVGNPGWPRIQEGTIGAPDLEPASGHGIVVIVVRLGSPADAASGRPLEHLLRNLAVVTESAVQVLGEAVPQEGKHATRVQGQHRAQGRG